MEGLALIAAAILGGGGIGSLVLAIRRPRGSGDRENTFIDQLQEERGGALERIRGLEARELIRDDYIMLLRQHIAEGKPPPPPPFPAGLVQGGHQ